MTQRLSLEAIITARNEAGDSFGSLVADVAAARETLDNLQGEYAVSITANAGGALAEIANVRRQEDLLEVQPAEVEIVGGSERFDVIYEAVRERLTELSTGELDDQASGGRHPGVLGHRRRGNAGRRVRGKRRDGAASRRRLRPHLQGPGVPCRNRRPEVRLCRGSHHR